MPPHNIVFEKNYKPVVRRRVLGASAVIQRLQTALDNGANWIERGYANVPADAEAIRDAIVLLHEMAATSNEEVSA